MADLSKVKVSNTTYNLKDATARADLLTLLGSHALTALGDAAWLGVDATLADDGTGVATSGTIKSYVDSMIETIPEFDVVVIQGELPTASADTFHKIYLQDASSPVSPNLYMEWITIRSGSDPNYTYTWEKIGDTAMDLSSYVTKATTIAGIDLQDNITKQELQTALELGNMAYADTASETLDDYVTGITGADYTPAGDITLNAFTQTATEASLTKGDYTPAGDVTVTLSNANVVSSVESAGTVPSFTEGTFTANTPTEIDVTKFNGGTAATWTGASYSAPSLGNATTDSFATAGVLAEVGTGDDAETLIITTASTASAVTAQGTFDAGVVDFGTFDGGTAASLGAGFYTAGTAASKAADTFSAGAMPTFSTATVGVSSATFAGTTASNILVTAVSYDKATANGATFAGTSSTITPTLTTGNKTVTVTPDA